MTAVLAAACSGEQGALTPKGPAAGNLALLWWVMLVVAGVVYVFVIGLLVLGLARRGDHSSGHRGDRLFIIGGGLVLPAVVLSALVGFNLYTALALPSGGDLEIQVVGKRWWWEVRYPEAGIITANELRIPVGREVRVLLYADDVNHSFWVPELAGKRDLIPGRENRLVFEADEPGIYRGQCAEFCGIQHANMAFFVRAEEPDDFRAWVERAAEDARDPQTAAERRGYDTFMNSACVGCHAIRGTPADGDLGPDLTHFASRLTIGAGTLPNDRGHLGGWIANAQSSKPGNLMPPQPVPADQLPNLITYLESLQ